MSKRIYMSEFDKVKLYGDKSLADVFKEIHKNSRDIDKQINSFIDALKPVATANVGNVVQMMPTVTNLIDINVKNNEQLIKMAAVAQRAMATNSNNNESIINYDEIQKLIDEQNNLATEAQKLIEAPKQIDNK